MARLCVLQNVCGAMNMKFFGAKYVLRSRWLLVALDVVDGSLGFSRCRLRVGTSGTGAFSGPPFSCLKSVLSFVLTERKAISGG